MLSLLIPVFWGTLYNLVKNSLILCINISFTIILWNFLECTFTYLLSSFKYFSGKLIYFFVYLLLMAGIGCFIDLKGVYMMVYYFSFYFLLFWQDFLYVLLSSTKQFLDFFSIIYVLSYIGILL